MGDTACACLHGGAPGDPSMAQWWNPHPIYLKPSELSVLTAMQWPGAP